MEKVKNRKNIMLLVPLLDQGGLERICAMTANLLNDRYNLILVVFSTKNMLYDVSAVELYDLKLGSRPGALHKAINVFRRIRAVKRIKKQKNIRITYSFGPSANLINALSGAGDKIWIGIRGYGALKSKASMRLTCRRADKVICCAREMADDVEALFHPKSVECLYNPCDTKLLRSMEKEQGDLAHRRFIEAKSPIIASMGRADDVKGFWHQIKAFSLIKKEVPGAGLMIIGDGDFSQYGKLATELGIGDSVLFTGVQKNPFRYLKKAALYIMTSATEGFPNAMVEAMAVGLPIVSVNCKTGPAEILTKDYRQAKEQDKVYEGEYGILLPVMNPSKNLDAGVIEEEEKILAEAVINLLNEPERLKMLGESAELRSGFFSTERYVERLSEMIDQN